MKNPCIKSELFCDNSHPDSPADQRLRISQGKSSCINPKTGIEVVYSGARKPLISSEAFQDLGMAMYPE